MTRKEEYERTLKNAGSRSLKNMIIQCVDWLITDAKTIPTERYRMLDEIENIIRMRKLMLEK
jgi:hypothetical protein